MDTVKQLRFIHIPKNAGTSIEDWGNTYGYSWGRFDPNCPNIEPKKDGIWHSPAKHWKIDDNIDYFCIIRHPYGRFISAVNFIYPNGLRKDINKFIKEDLKDIIETGYPRAFIPQYNYVFNTDTGEQVVENILLYNDLVDDFKDLMIKYRCKYAYRDLPRSNVTKSKLYSLTDLNEKSLDILNEVYNKDFDLSNLRLNLLKNN